MSQKIGKNLLSTISIILFSTLTGLLSLFLQPGDNRISGFFSACCLSLLILFILFGIWQLAGSNKHLHWMMLIAFVLRIFIGAFLFWGLPKFGYNEQVQQSGYLYADAFTRDGYAWQLASSEETLFKAFGKEFMADQYGGLLAFSALIYRIFSVNFHRPLLMAIVSAGAAAAGIPFLFYATKYRFTKKVAYIATWIMVLYPESLLLGASQMREPFLISLSAICLWSMLRWIDKKRDWKTYLGTIVGIVGLGLFSYRAAIPILVVLMIWAGLELWNNSTQKKNLLTVFAITTVSLLMLVFISIRWLKDVMRWDLLQTYVASGWIQYIFETLPAWLRSPFIVIYGLFQPLLPAAIADPAPWIWRVLGIIRGIGWYAILPFLAVALIRVWKNVDKSRKWLLVWMILSIFGWLFLASIRAGGDQWDNPRYRTIFLPWISIIVAWVYVWTRESKDRWLGRILIIEAIFLLFFTQWYISRYYSLFAKLPFGVMVILIVILSGIVLLGGWYFDHMQKRR